MVYVFSGYSVEVPMDYVRGRGLWREVRAVKFNAEDGPCSLELEIEQAYAHAPVDFLVRLLTEPLEHFTLMSLVQAARYVVEHKLFAWVCEQNGLYGVAPSRAQLVEKAVASIPDLAPIEAQERLSSWLNAPVRSQRRWLAKFRRRWGARIGRLRPGHVLPPEERQRKVGRVDEGGKGKTERRAERGQNQGSVFGDPKRPRFRVG